MKILSDLEAFELLEGLGLDDKQSSQALKVFRSAPPTRQGTPVENREDAINLAREMFIATGFERNISTAFEMFQDHFAAVKYPAKITVKDTEYTIPKLFTDDIRPVCPECGGGMAIWRVNTSPKTMVGGDFKTQWICKNEIGCGYQDDYSTLGVGEWHHKLKKQARV